VSTRDRVVVAAMDLFGRQGYQATTVAQIEAAVGLSAGSGGLYRHFRTKRELLEAGLRHQAEAGRPLLDFLSSEPGSSEPGSSEPGSSRRDRFLAVARAGLRRLDAERDVNRLLLRDLAAFPDLLDQVREQELRRVFDALAGWLRSQGPGVDHEALAAVLMAAVSHYWVLRDVYGGVHPHGVAEDRFLATLADMAEALLATAG
jgi:AcrR family transcriptional regulator